MKLSFEVWPNAPYEGMEIVGVPLNSWGNKPLDWCAERVAQYGYQGVDFILDSFLEMSDKEYARTLEVLGDVVKSKGMEIPSIGAHHLVVTPKRWKREGGIASTKKAIDIAAKLGAKTIVCYIAGYYNPPTYKLLTLEEGKNIFVSMVRECAEYAKDKGVEVSIEPHDSTLINLPGITLELLERINMDNVFITIDFVGIQIGMTSHMSVEEALNKFAGKINHVHAKDATGIIGNWNMCWFGAGQVNFERYAAALRKMGYQGYICVEWEGWFKGGRDAVGDTYDTGLADFDRAAKEAKEFLEKYF